MPCEVGNEARKEYPGYQMRKLMARRNVVPALVGKKAYAYICLIYEESKEKYGYFVSAAGALYNL